MSDKKEEWKADGNALVEVGITEAGMARATQVLERQDRENEDLKCKLADLSAK